MPMLLWVVSLIVLTACSEVDDTDGAQEVRLAAREAYVAEREARRQAALVPLKAIEQEARAVWETFPEDQRVVLDERFELLGDRAMDGLDLATLELFRAILEARQSVLEAERSVLEAELEWIEQELRTEWIFERKTDDFTDEDLSYIFRVSQQDEDAIEAVLGINCGSIGSSGVFYSIGEPMTGDSDSRVRVRYRIDRNNHIDYHYWNLDQDGTKATMPHDGVDVFLAEAIGGQELLLEIVDPVDDQTLRHEFSLAGLATVVERLSCR